MSGSQTVNSNDSSACGFPVTKGILYFFMISVNKKQPFFIHFRSLVFRLCSCVNIKLIHARLTRSVLLLFSQKSNPHFFSFFYGKYVVFLIKRPLFHIFIHICTSVSFFITKNHSCLFQKSKTFFMFFLPFLSDLSKRINYFSHNFDTIFCPPLALFFEICYNILCRDIIDRFSTISRYQTVQYYFFIIYPIGQNADCASGYRNAEIVFQNFIKKERNISHVIIRLPRGNERKRNVFRLRKRSPFL